MMYLQTIRYELKVHDKCPIILWLNQLQAKRVDPSKKR